MKLKTLSYSLFFYFLSALGISLTIKANIGVSSFNALNVALAELTTIKIGTITTMTNLLFLLIGFSLDLKKDIKKYCFMIISIFLFGEVINLFLYTLLSKYTIENYLLKILFFVIGTIIAGFSTGKVIKAGMINFSIENLCDLLAVKTDKTFKFYRYSIDAICIIISIIISLVFNFPIFIREGTLISFILLSAVISWSKR